MSREHPPLAPLRNVSVRRIVRALEYEGFQFTERQGSQRVYRHADGCRIIIHFHRPNDTLTPLCNSLSPRRYPLDRGRPAPLGTDHITPARTYSPQTLDDRLVARMSMRQDSSSHFTSPATPVGRDGPGWAGDASDGSPHTSLSSAEWFGQR